MFRLLFRLIVLLLIFAILRYLVTSVARFFSQAANPTVPRPAENQASKGEIGGELKQDPVCGTFVSTSLSVKKTINGELIHFCSVDCRDKFKVA